MQCQPIRPPGCRRRHEVQCVAVQYRHRYKHRQVEKLLPERKGWGGSGRMRGNQYSDFFSR